MRDRRNGALVVVSDQCFDFHCGELLEVGLAVIDGVDGNERVVGQGSFHYLDHRNQKFLFAAGAMSLRFDDDLMFGIYGRHAGVALDDAFARRNLGGFVLGAAASSLAA